MKWIHILFLGFITVMFTDCSGCSKSGRDQKRRQSYNNVVSEPNQRPTENIPTTIDGNSDDDYTLPSRKRSPKKDLTTTELAKLAEPCVFLVNTFDEDGKGAAYFLR